MDKNRFKSLMQEYKEIPRSDVTEDLKKYYDKQKQNEKVSMTKHYNKKLVWSSLVLSIMIITVLSITLSLYFTEDKDNDNGINGPDKNEIHYYMSDSLEYETIDSIEIFNAENQCEIKYITTDLIESAFKTIKIKEDGRILGLGIEMTVWSETIDNVKMYCYIGNDRIQNYAFSELVNEVAYNGQTVKYKIDMVNEIDYTHYIEFIEDGICYNIIASCYQEMEIPSLLDQIFI